MFASICTSIDKLDKEPWDQVQNELKEKGLTYDQVSKLGDIVNGDLFSGTDSFETTIGKLEKMFENV